jgi:hypothetical protein
MKEEANVTDNKDQKSMEDYSMYGTGTKKMLNMLILDILKNILTANTGSCSRIL